MKHKFLIAMVTLFTSHITLASEQISHREIARIQIYESYAIVHFDTSIDNVDECTHSHADKSVGIDISTEGGRSQLASVMSARVAGLSLGFGTNGCINWGSPTVPQVYRVDF